MELINLGMDTSINTIVVGVLRPGEELPVVDRIFNDEESIRRLIGRFADRRMLSACYEADPGGYELYRLLTSMGVACEVIAPSLIPKGASDRVKTDKRDAIRLARLHRAGELTAIRVPTPAEEAVRDLVRARGDVLDDRKRMQQRLNAVLMRHGRIWRDGSNDPWCSNYGQANDLPPRTPAHPESENTTASPSGARRHPPAGLAANTCPKTGQANRKNHNTRPENGHRMSSGLDRPFHMRPFHMNIQPTCRAPGALGILVHSRFGRGRSLMTHFRAVRDWTDEGGETRSALWRSESGAPLPTRVVVADDRVKADVAYRLAGEGTAILWRGDFQNARQLLAAMGRRVDRKRRVYVPSPALAFHQYRQARAQRARRLGMLLVPFDAGCVIPLRRAPDVRQACVEAGCLTDEPFVLSLRELLGIISAREWRDKGVVTDQDARALACARENVTRLGLTGRVDVVGRLDAKPRHPRVSDRSDPLRAARAAETTSLWWLTPAVTEHCMIFHEHA